jgi:2,4-dienoyl-CoA reductase-like NADH-dependent reductase (Old Yellow Enzyme family)
MAKAAGFAGARLHETHSFLLSQLPSPLTNCRSDDYGDTPEKRMKLLKRLVTEIREVCPPRPFCLSVKLNPGDHITEGGLMTDEVLEQARRLLECGEVDFVEMLGGNSEHPTKLHSESKWISSMLGS